MNLINKDFFANKEKKMSFKVIILLIIITVFLVAYIYSFKANVFWISLLIGVAGVSAALVYYYLVIFQDKKLLKLYKNISSGIFQEDEYTFDCFEELTEHDGVMLRRVRAVFVSDGQTFERTLYFLHALPYPKLQKGQKIHVRTYQNIITYIKD